MRNIRNKKVHLISRNYEEVMFFDIIHYFQTNYQWLKYNNNCQI